MPELQDRLQAALGDSYRLEREIGGGGMSRLFLATEASLNRQVVIKLLPPEMASDVSAARFKQEIELAAHLQHPNVLPVLTAGAREDLIYYVLPYVSGDSLRHRLTAQGKLPLDEIHQILGEVADALAYAHAQGVVHRDIKPENILLQHGHAVLTDFGVARAVAEARSGGRLTATGMAVGTPGYMSPEQAAGETHIDARADVYSLAVVGYEMLTGHQPFTGPSAQAVLAAHLTETPKPVTEFRSDTPPALTTAITKALAKSPAERLQTAAEFRDAVKSVSGSAAAVRATRKRWAIAGGAVAAVAAVAALVFWPRGFRVEGDPRKSLIVFPFENRTGDAALDWLEDGSMNLLGLGLAHWEDLRVFDDERTASLIRRRQADGGGLDFETAQAMAQEARVGTLVLGDVRYQGDSLVIEAKVHDVASGNRLATEILRTSRAADPRVLFDSLTARVLLVSGAPAGERPGVVSQTTRSLDAYRAYLRGSEALQRFELDSAQRYLEQAVARDSTFALAYIQLRNAEGWRPTGGDREKRRRYIAQAEARSQSLPPRLRSLVQYHVTYERGDFRRARQIVEQMIARDSTDVEAWYQLGEAHFHHQSGTFPHADTLGNGGKGLHAFERSLALDSSYVLAYFHITQLLGTCADPAARWVCLPDSAIYGEPDALRARLGRDRIERLRGEAARRQIEVGYAWIARVPNSEAPRRILFDALIQRKRYTEAETQAQRLRELGNPQGAAMREAQALYGQRRFAEAARLARESAADLSDEELRRDLGAFFGVPGALFTAGRVKEGFELLRRVLGALPVREQVVVSGDGGSVTIPVALDRRLVQLADSFGSPGWYGSEDVRLARAAWQEIRTVFADSVDFQRFLNSPNGRWLGQYLRSRDTTLLDSSVALLFEGADHPARAHLALARGDRARAEALAARHVRDLPASPAEWTSQHPLDAYAWADLLASLGRPREALELYARIDSVDVTVTGDLLVRSWAERAALHQALGERVRAIELYKRVMAALEEADERVLPFADRVRAALAALEGRTAETRR